MKNKRITRRLCVGGLSLGGDAPITVQSMTNTDTHDAYATEAQVRALQEAGCDIVRLAVPDIEAASIFRTLKAHGITLPLVADIHFDYRIALAAVAAGADKIRINPGNIGSHEGVAEVVRACREREIPIRIGVNSGSLQKEIYQKYGAPTAEALAESALRHAALLEELDYRNIAISVKSSHVPTMIAANRLLAERCDYPLHLGVTEAGGGESALVKSSIGIGTLLAEGIGDTVRVSLTDSPVEEVFAARRILSALELTDSPGMNIISCPTCGRTKIDLIRLSKEFSRRVRESGLDRLPITVALMGCVVNGPGEAREADLGIAGGRGEGLLFSKGEIIAKVSEEHLIDALLDEIVRRYGAKK